MVRPLFIPAFWPRPHPFQVQIVPVSDVSQLVWLLCVAVTLLKFPRTAVVFLKGYDLKWNTENLCSFLCKLPVRPDWIHRSWIRLYRFREPPLREPLAASARGRVTLPDV